MSDFATQLGSLKYDVSRPISYTHVSAGVWNGAFLVAAARRDSRNGGASESRAAFSLSLGSRSSRFVSVDDEALQVEETLDEVV